MVKTKALLAIGTILLFLGLSLSPATAQVSPVDDFLEIGVWGDDGELQIHQLDLTDSELLELDGFFNELMDRMQNAQSYLEIRNILLDFILEYGRHPVLVFFLELLVKSIEIHSNLYQLFPIKRKALVVSWGFANKLFALRENKAELYLPFTLWYYSGRSNYLVNSRTLIIDPYPFQIKTLSGRQIGMMVNFAGVYVYRHSTITDKSYTFFLGYANYIGGFDLSPPLFGDW